MKSSTCVQDPVTTLSYQSWWMVIKGRFWEKLLTPYSLSKQDVMCGILWTWNLSHSHLSNLSYLVHLEKQAYYQQWTNGNARYQNHIGRIPSIFGIICGNFGWHNVGRCTCDGVCHAQCYQKGKNNKFPVLLLVDLDASLIDKSVFEEEDPLGFKETRYDNHMLVPFQCDLCHFFNICQRLLVTGNHQHNPMLLCIWWVSLEIIWARERSTVGSKTLEGVCFIKTQKFLGLEHDKLPQQGPYPAEDVSDLVSIYRLITMIYWIIIWIPDFKPG